MTQKTAVIKVIIPAFNEADSIGHVLREIPSYVSEVIVVDNASTDHTAERARSAGATVLSQPEMGYGNACLKGMEYLDQVGKAPDILVFLDGDYSDYPADMDALLKPLLEEGLDFALGARKKSLREPGSMTPQQVFGNALATTLMKILYRAQFTDLGPFRAIRYKRLLELKMQDKTYGWTVEMQLKALRHKLAYTEVPVRYKKRIGISKVSGTVKGTIFAGVKILGWIFRYGIY
jgi:glycosyltransferase involved in cell wall biosynthesis